MINFLASVVIVSASICPATGPVPVTLRASYTTPAPTPAVDTANICTRKLQEIRDHFTSHGMTPPAYIHTCQD